MNHNIAMVRGDTLAFAVKITFDNDAQELETCYFTCKSNYADKTPVFQKSLDNGIYLSEQDGESLYYIIRVAPADTRNIEAGRYYYDLQIGVNGDVFTVMGGVLDVMYDVTAVGDNIVGYQSRTVNPSTIQQIITPTDGYEALSEVIVTAVPDGNEESY